MSLTLASPLVTSHLPLAVDLLLLCLQALPLCPQLTTFRALPRFNIPYTPAWTTLAQSGNFCLSCPVNHQHELLSCSHVDVLVQGPGSCGHLVSVTEHKGARGEQPGRASKKKKKISPP
jgi:hypothetical protein